MTTELRLEVPVEVKGNADLDRLNGQLDDTAERTGKLGAVGQGVFQGLGQAAFGFGKELISAGISAVIDNISGSIQLASDKAEAASKVNVLYGDSANQIVSASQNAATAVGLSSGKYLEAAGTLGNLLVNFGITGKAAADMSVDMIQLAADVGSFNNADPTDVVEAMGAAFRGESEPIRRFGVMLDEATIKAKAAELGLYDGVGALDASARATATYQLILEQTTKAQGDFARTSDGLANGQRIANAKVEEAWTRVGEVLEPLAAEIVPQLADGIVTLIGWVEQGIKAVGDWADDNRDLLDSIADVARQVWDFYTKYLSVLINVIGELGYRVGGLIGLFIDLAGAIIDTGSAIIKLFSGDFEGAAEAGQRALDRLSSFQANVQRAMGDTARGMADAAAKSFGEVEPAADAAMSDTINTLAGGYAAAADTAQTGGQDIGLSTDRGITGGLEQGKSLVDGAADDIAGLLPSSLLDGQREAERIAAKTPGEIAAGLRSTRDSWHSALDQLKTDLTNTMDAAKEEARLRAVLTGKAVTAGLASTDPIVRAQAEETVRLITERLNQLENVGKAAGGDVGSGVASALRAKYDDVGNAANGLARIIEKKLELGSPAEEGPWSKRGGPVKWMERNAELMVGGLERGFSSGRALFSDLGSGVSLPDMGGRSSGPSYYITVQAGVGDPVAIGRETVAAIQAYERSGGRDWRASSV